LKIPMVTIAGDMQNFTVGASVWQCSEPTTKT
jgi:hypothetical protein